MGKLARLALRGFVITARSIRGIGKPTQKPISVSHADLSFPQPSLPVVGNTFEPTGVPSLLRTVSQVLRAGALAQILSAIIERIVILVIRVFSGLAAQNHAMHVDAFAPGDGVETLGCWAEFRSPAPVQKKLKIVSIDNSVLPLREGDKTVGFAQRLRNCVAFHAVLHRSTSHGLLKLSRYYILLLLLCPAVSVAQGVHIAGVAQARSGLPAPGVSVAVCSEPATVSTTPCSTLATLYTDATLGTACSGTLLPPPSSPGGPCSNPLLTDGLGNYAFYIAPGRDAVQFYGTGITTYSLRDQVYACDPTKACTISGTATLSTVLGGPISTIAASPTGATESGSTVTITTTAICSFLTGQAVTVAGVGVAGYNGSFVVLSPGCNGTSSFTYTNPTSGLAASGGGTVTGSPIFLSGLTSTGLVSTTGPGTHTGAETFSRFFKRCYVDGITYPTLSAALLDTVNCSDIYLPPGYTETQTGGLFHFNRSNVAIHCMGGICAITNTAGWKVDAGTNHVAFLSDNPYGMDGNGANAGGLSFSGFTGSGVAFQVGDGTATTSYMTLKNVHVDISAAAAGAIAIKWFRTQFFYTDNFSCLLGAASQICSTTDGTGAFTGIGEMHNSFITAGVSGSNAIGIQSGPLTTHFKVSGGNIALIQAGTSACFDANGGEIWLDFPNCNTAITAVTVELNGASVGRVTGWLRVDSGVTNGANFGASTVGSHIFCANCSAALPVTDSGGVNSFNSFITPDTLFLNSNRWSFQAATGNFTLRDIVNAKGPISIVPGGNIFLGNGSPQLILDTGNRFTIPETSAGIGSLNNDVLWADSTAHRLKMNNNNGGASSVVGDTDTQTLTNKTLTSPVLITPNVGGGSILTRYNFIQTASLTCASVAAGAVATQSFTITGIQAGDHVLGAYWNTQQTVGIEWLAFRVTAANTLAIDIGNPATGALTPSCGVLNLTLAQ